jgi:Beta-lactamase enzyme family
VSLRVPIASGAIAVLSLSGATEPLDAHPSHPATVPTAAGAPIQNEPVVRPPPPIERPPIVGPRWVPGISSAKRYAARRAGEVSFAVIDWWGRLRGLHKRRTAPSASVVKVMLLVAYLRRPSVRNRPLRRSDRALLRPMIRRSDNGAASRVTYLVGARRVERLARAVRMRDFRFNPVVWGLSRISPRDQARLMYRLERYVPRRHRRFALRQLAHIVPRQRWGIGRASPPRWALYFKGGWGGGSGWVNHQVALLKHGPLRVSLAIFTYLNPSHAYGKETLRGVAARLLRGLGPSVDRRRGGLQQRSRGGQSHTRPWPSVSAGGSRSPDPSPGSASGRR